MDTFFSSTTKKSRFHAFFWDRPALAGESLPSGCWFRKSLRAGLNYGKLPASYLALCEAFPENAAEFALDTGAETLALLERLAASVHDIYPRNTRIRTVVHGDVKTCNFFLGTDACAASSSAGATLGIDFQWLGTSSSGSADIVYFMFGGVRPPEPFSFAAMLALEEQLVAHYYSVFSAAVASRSGSGISREEFDRDYARDLIDYFTTAVPYLLAGLNKTVAAENAQKYGWVTIEFDPHITMYFCRRAIDKARLSLY